VRNRSSNFQKAVLTIDMLKKQKIHTYNWSVAVVRNLILLGEKKVQRPMEKISRT